ncbi:MAG: DUF3108 domain-containing protein [Woeseiaceae bacterium]
MRPLIYLIALVCSPAFALTPFTATYEGKVSGLSARNQLTLSPPDASGQIEFRSVAKARGFARMLKSDPIVEYTRFEEVDGRFLPLEYHYLFNTRGSKRNASIIFNRENLIAKSLYKTETVELDIQSGHVDRMLETLIFRTDLLAGKVAEKYLYIDRNTLREAVYEELGSETISTKAGTFDTVVYRRQRVGSTRSQIIWYAPELEYLPVQMQHFRKDKRTGTVTLAHYALGSVTPR